MSVNKYDLVGTHIDYMRRKIRETSDDSYFTDEEIYKSLLDARAMIIERRLKKGKEYPDSMYQTICMLLCLDDYNDCNCVPPGYDCKVLKTVEELPESFYNGYVSIQRISTLGGEEIAPTTEALARRRKYKKTGQDRLYYILNNKRISVFNSPANKLKAIKIKALFQDPIGAAEAAGCPDGTDCTDVVIGTGFNTRMSDNIDMYDIAMKSLIMTKQLPEDRSNDAESSVLPSQKY
jgi:hypothetical protein